MKNKPKQTAVEWLEEQLISSLGIELTKHQKRLFNDVFIKQAKEMEKDQIIQAYTLGHVFHDSNDESAAEFYYKTEYETSNN